MKKFNPDDLRSLTKRFFLALGFSDEEAEIGSDHLIENNLLGIHSHGIIRILQYALEVKEQKRLKLNVTPKILRQEEGVTLMDAGFCLGPVAGIKASETAIDLAKRYGIGNVTVKNCHHTGRVGAYTSLAAKNNMIGLACFNCANKNIMRVAPFGGREGRITTNPISFACPRNKEFPFLVDMATSTVAEGKVRVAKNKKEKIPNDWIIDKFGKSSNNPKDLYNGGALLPLGGYKQGHKGFALGLIVEILAGALSGNKVAQKNIQQDGGGFFILVLDINKYLPLDEFKNEIEKLFLHIKDTPKLPGFEEIFIPGEIEYYNKIRNLREGIFLEDKTWNDIIELSKNLKIDIRDVIHSET
ncbi:MAG: Ldh family oxidoreductase [Caldisericia bacterium]|nr:Ldh family oxidoreductase [Caldisericia bacterium]